MTYFLILTGIQDPQPHGNMYRYKGTLAAVDRIHKEFDAKVMGWKEELEMKLKSIKSNLRELIAETGLVMFN